MSSTVPTGVNGTQEKPWIGDTYTVLDADGEIIGWVIRSEESPTEGGWASVYRARPGFDDGSWEHYVADNLPWAYERVAFARTAGPGGPELRRKDFHRAVLAIEEYAAL